TTMTISTAMRVTMRERRRMVLLRQRLELLLPRAIVVPVERLVVDAVVVAAVVQVRAVVVRRLRAAELLASLFCECSILKPRLVRGFGVCGGDRESARRLAVESGVRGAVRA